MAGQDRGIKAHISSLEQTQKGTGTKKGISPKEAFSYNADTDTFTCPAGQSPKRRKLFKKRQHYEYIATAGTCSRCQLKKQCTKAKSGRTLNRCVRQDDLDLMLKQAGSPESKKDIKTRQNLKEKIRGKDQGHILNIKYCQFELSLLYKSCFQRNNKI